MFLCALVHVTLANKYVCPTCFLSYQPDRFSSQGQITSVFKCVQNEVRVNEKVLHVPIKKRDKKIFHPLGVQPIKSKKWCRTVRGPAFLKP